MNKDDQKFVSGLMSMMLEMADGDLAKPIGEDGWDAIHRYTENAIAEKEVREFDREMAELTKDTQVYIVVDVIDILWDRLNLHMDNRCVRAYDILRDRSNGIYIESMNRHYYTIAEAVELLEENL